MIFSFYILLLLGSLLVGLVLLGLGVFLLVSAKNKLAGILLMVAGLASSLFPIAVLLFLIAIPTQG